MIVIVDYGMGNLRSVQKAGEFLGHSLKVTDSPISIKKAKKIIFPGVGHFGKAVFELKKRKIFDILIGRIKEGIPFFGICLGMQLLLEKSEEAKGVRGLSVLGGVVKKFKLKQLIVPHMGWNKASLRALRYAQSENNLFKEIPNNSYFYFAHSYYCVPEDKGVVLTTTDYGVKFASSLYSKNIWGVQFHPEKSQKLGLKLYQNFIELCGK